MDSDPLTETEAVGTGVVGDGILRGADSVRSRGARVISIQAHFDGKVIVPHDPVDLPRDTALIVRLEAVPESVPAGEESCLDWLAEHSVDSTAVPTDLSFQHDHYLYGSPKRDA